MSGLIKESFIERIKEEADLKKVMESTGAEFKKVGSGWRCHSPFNPEKSPSCMLPAGQEFFKDFSSGKSGNVVTFVMEYYQKSYPEAIIWIADFFNLQVEYEDADWAKKELERRTEKEDLRKYLKAAHRKYQEELTSVDQSHHAYKELERRGYSKEVVVEWGIGYAPGKGVIYNLLKQAGAVKEGRDVGLIGDSTDQFWNRLMYPIHDRNGLIVGFGGRDLSGKDNSVKWQNSRNNKLYQKSKVIYGLHKAARSIAKNGEVYIVEGYNDVISMHLHGVTNTVAASGTSISEDQIKQLLKYKGSFTFILDGDKAGYQAVIKLFPKLVENGVTSASTIRLPDGLDPDDFTRERRELFQGENSGVKDLAEYLKTKAYRRNCFQLLIEHHVTKKGLSVENRLSGIKTLCELIAKVKEDQMMQDLYMEWLAKEGQVKIGVVKRTVKEFAERDAEKKQAAANESWTYNLPEELNRKVSLTDLKPDIEKYGLFQAANKIWVKRGSEAPYNFTAVSNFSIEIIQHMNDEKFPMKLLRIQNVYGVEKIFDCLSNDIMSPQSFMQLLAGQGNFLWKGGRSEHLQLLQQLMDRMGSGEKIEVLGWNPAGFFLFNNRVVFPDGSTQDIDENGVFRIKEEDREKSYYVPSANRIYANAPYKFESQKKVRVQGNASLSFAQYTSKMMEVHREHAITGILFTLASMFQDIVVSQLGNFPLVFLYGPPSTGKDQLIECCQSFFGNPQVAINLEGGVSTNVAKLRELAQFANLMSHLSEYKRGDNKLDGMLKGMWDRRGYKKGNIDGRVTTDSIPVLSSVFLTGNDYPDQDALITRLVWEEMSKTEFSLDEMKSYEELKDMYKSGVSHLTVELLGNRKLFEETFKSNYSWVSKEFKSELAMAATHSRIISNLAILGATYYTLKDQVRFPFGWNDILKHFKEIIERQVRKLNTASIHNKWWDCFLVVIRTEKEPLRAGVDFTIYDNRIYFNFTNTYNKVAPQWYRQYYEMAPSKGKIRDMIQENDRLDLQKHSAYRFDGTTTGARTSAWSVNLKETGVLDEIFEAVEWQERNHLDRQVKPSPGGISPSYDSEDGSQEELKY